MSCLTRWHRKAEQSTKKDFNPSTERTSQQPNRNDQPGVHQHCQFFHVYCTLVGQEVQ